MNHRKENSIQICVKSFFFFFFNGERRLSLVLFQAYLRLNNNNSNFGAVTTV